jgi:hypothetical protein
MGFYDFEALAEMLDINGNGEISEAHFVNFTELLKYRKRTRLSKFLEDEHTDDEEHSKTNNIN